MVINDNKNSDIINHIRSLPELTSLKRPALRRIAQTSRLVSFVKGQIIFQAGDTPKDVWVVLEGKVVLGYESLEGNASASCIAKEKDLFCCLPTLDQKPYPVTAICEVPTRVLRIPLKTFTAIMDENPECYRAFVLTTCKKLRHIECSQCHRVEKVAVRIAHTLMELSQKYGKKIPLTRYDIARLSGTTVETAIRTLNDFKKEGITSGKKGIIIIEDADKLHSVS